MLPIIEEFKALGVAILPLPKKNALLIQPSSKVPEELKQRLIAQKPQVLAFLTGKIFDGTKVVSIN